MATILIPANAFNDPAKLVANLCKFAAFDDTRAGFQAWKARIMNLLAKLQIPGSPHKLGLVPLILTAAQFEQLGDVAQGYSAFPIPVNGDGNAHDNAVAQGQFREALLIHLSNHFEDLVSPLTYESFKTNPDINIVTLSFAEMYRAIFDEYGELTGPEIAAKTHELTLAAPPGVGYKAIHAAHMTIYLDLAANGTIIAETLKFQNLKAACANLGKWASKAIEAFITAHPARADQTSDRLNVALKAALRNAPDNTTTGATYGAHHATAPALAAAATITPQPSISDLLAKILAMEKLMLAPPPAAKAAAPQRKKQQTVSTAYCWHHGARGHTGSTCRFTPRPANFDATATIANRKGGSTHNVDLQLFP